ncbi:MAG: dehydratase, partial [bacterium]
QQGAKFLKPVFLDDTVTSAFTVTTLDAAPGKAWGTITLEATLTNQDGEAVLGAFHVYRIGRRPAVGRT